MQLKNLPNEQRPREKLLTFGSDQLTDAELLAIFLRTGVPGTNVLDLSRYLLTHFGGLRMLFSAPFDDFCAQRGLGAAKYAQLQAVIEMSRRYFAEQAEVVDALRSPQAVHEYLVSQLKDLDNEVFALLYLDSQHRVLKYETIFWGTVDKAAVYPRVVVKKVMDSRAVAVIFAHNHPSGESYPSDSDIAITDKLKRALALIDVRVVDHIIIGNELTSFAELGLL